MTLTWPENQPQQHPGHESRIKLANVSEIDRLEHSLGAGTGPTRSIDRARC